MNFELTPEQKQLADSVSKYLSNEYSFEKRKAIINSESGLSDTAWQTFANMGLTAMTLAEADNGFGGGAMDLMAVMEAMGQGAYGIVVAVKDLQAEDQENNLVAIKKIERAFEHKVFM